MWRRGANLTEPVVSRRKAVAQMTSHARPPATRRRKKHPARGHRRWRPGRRSDRPLCSLLGRRRVAGRNRARGLSLFLGAGQPANRAGEGSMRTYGPQDYGTVASIAATGFGLTALCIGANASIRLPRGARPRYCHAAFPGEGMPTHRGFFYHWANSDTAKEFGTRRSPRSTPPFCCAACLPAAALPLLRDTRLATKIFDRVDWTWLSEDTSLLPHGWMPEVGFLPYRWDYYSELMMMYLLGMGSSSHPLPVGNLACLEANDVRVRRPALHRLVRAAVRAPVLPGLVRLSRQARPLCGLLPELRDRYRSPSPLLPGTGQQFPITARTCGASPRRTRKNGYVVWGGPPEMGPIDGTVVPSAAGGSLPFLPRATLRVLKNIRNRYGSGPGAATDSSTRSTP